jgi:hypothetical protein
MSRKTLGICLAVITVTFLVSTVGAVDRTSRGHPRRQTSGYPYPRSTEDTYTQAPKRLGVFEVYGALSSPTGNIDHLGDINFSNIYRPININAGNAYNPSLTLGATLGTLSMGHWYNSVGFQYSRLRVKDTIFYPRRDSAIVFNYTDFPKPHYNQYEVRLNSNFHFYDLERVGWTPYLGLGLGMGVISQTLEGFDTQTEFNIGLAMNFGAEIRIWQDPNGGNMATLASANSWEFAGSGYRPKFFTMGVSLKMYTRM